MHARINDVRRLIKEALINAYSILGLGKNATPDQIKSAWKTLALQYHPDRNLGKDTTDQMKAVNMAKDILLNPEIRAKLDYQIRNNIPAAAPPGRVQSSTTPPPPAQNTPRPPPASPPPPPPKPKTNSGTRSGSSPQKRYFVYKSPAQPRFEADRPSKKFWWITDKPQYVNGISYVEVGWGRLGTVGQKKVYKFDSEIKALMYIRRMINQKMSKGYVEGSTPNPSSQQQKSSNTPPPAANEPNKSKPEPGAAGKEYKIYGRKAGKPVHTRYKGRVYTPSGQTKFKPGNKAQVGLGSDGRLSVHGKDPQSGNWTQSWDETNESLKTTINNLVLEFIVEQAHRQ
jgi:curved DNA-binding protein CbpA